MDNLGHEWTLIVEGIFLEYGCVLLGVCNPKDHKLVLNPTKADFDEFGSPAAFFSNFHMGIVIADEQSMVDAVGNETADIFVIDRIIKSIIAEEKVFACRFNEQKEKKAPKATPMRKSSSVSKSAAKDIFGRPVATETLIQNLEKVSIDDILDSAELCVGLKKGGLGTLAEDEDMETDSDEASVGHHEDDEVESYTGVPLHNVGVAKRKGSDSDGDDGSAKGSDDDSEIIETLLNRMRAKSTGSDSDYGGSDANIDYLKTKVRIISLLSAVYV